MSMRLFRKHEHTSSPDVEPKVGAQPGDDLPIWPSGIARYSSGILEVTTDGTRVAVGDITDIAIKPPRGGRLSLKLKYRAGLNKVGCGYWVEQHNEAALSDLVQRITTDMTTA